MAFQSFLVIKGNEAADRAAKGTLTSAISIAWALELGWKSKVVQVVQHVRGINSKVVQINNEMPVF